MTDLTHDAMKAAETPRAEMDRKVWKAVRDALPNEYVGWASSDKKR